VPGTGKEKRQRSILIKIPPGVDNDTQIRLSGEGEAGTRGGSPGNLYATLSVKPHQLFTRDGYDILYELPINFAQAALGAKLVIPTLYGEVKLDIPAGCQSGRIFRLKNKGIPHLYRSGRGDQIVRLLIVTPDKLTERQRQLFQELANSLGLAKRVKKES